MNVVRDKDTCLTAAKSTRANTRLSVPQGTFELIRIPENEKLQAWEAADEYLLKQLDEEGILSESQKILIVNDSFGALSVVLAKYEPTMMTDSYLAQKATMRNMQGNNLPADLINYINSLDSGRDNEKVESKTTYDLILIKIPKSQTLLKHQLQGLKKFIGPGTQIFAAGMVRSIHKKTLQLFERFIGPTKTSLAWKKSRLVFSTPDLSLKISDVSPVYKFVIEDDEHKFTISSHANVFSRNRLDEGSHLLIENMPVADKFKNIADLGCGNGVIGIIATSLNNPGRMVFVDESYMAVVSAQENFKTAFGDKLQAEFKVTDCLGGIADSSMDLILNNPPFHQLNAIGDAIAWKMFMDAKRVLKQYGELYVVGNRHLGYHSKLKKVFGQCEMVTSNKKFVVLKAIKK